MLIEIERSHSHLNMSRHHRHLGPYHPSSSFTQFPKDTNEKPLHTFALLLSPKHNYQHLTVLAVSTLNTPLSKTQIALRMSFLLMGRVFTSSHQFHQWIRYRTIDLLMAQMPRNRGKLWIAENCARLIIRIEDLMVSTKTKILYCNQALQSGNCVPPYGFKRGYQIQVLLLKYKLELSGYRHLNYALFDQQMRMQLVISNFIPFSLASNAITNTHSVHCPV